MADKNDFTYSFEEGDWHGAELWEWFEGEGELIGHAVFGEEFGDNPPRKTIRVDVFARGTTFVRNFVATSPKDLLLQVAPWVWELRSR